MTGFNETLDQFYERLTVGRCYVVSGGTIKQVNPQYNNTSHSCEITLGRQTTIEDSEEPSGPNAIAKHNYNFGSIASVEATPDDSKVDVCAVVVKAEEPVTFTNKKGGETTKRVLLLTDESLVSIEATVFGERARDPPRCVPAM